MTYNNAKKVIQSGNYNYSSMATMLAAFLMRGLITQAQFDELMDAMDAQQTQPTV